MFVLKQKNTRNQYWQEVHYYENISTCHGFRD